jgi:Cys-rich repeat protein
MTRTRHTIRLGVVVLCGLCALALFGACDPAHDDNAERTTIDIRCSSNADCPAGFTCEAEVEHGPPTTMCESFDASVSCPAEYETRVGYGQTFCKPHGNVSSRHGTRFEVRHRSRPQARPGITSHGGNDR